MLITLYKKNWKKNDKHQCVTKKISEYRNTDVKTKRTQNRISKLRKKEENTRQERKQFTRIPITKYRK
jgi:hypothetical protein